MTMRVNFAADAGSLLVRTDFADDEAWERLLVRVSRLYGPDGFMAYFVAVDDSVHVGMGAEKRLN